MQAFSWPLASSSVRGRETAGKDGKEGWKGGKEESLACFGRQGEGLNWL